jgi:hypothetical protein
VLGEDDEQHALADAAVQRRVDDARHALFERERARRIGDAGQRVGLLRQRPLDRGADQAVLVAEVLVERADREAGRARDPIRGGRRVAVRAEDALRRVEERVDGAPGAGLPGPLPEVVGGFVGQGRLRRSDPDRRVARRG